MFVRRELVAFNSKTLKFKNNCNMLGIDYKSKIRIDISDMEKSLLNIKATKGNDDILTLAIDLVRSGSSKEEIKSKTGLSDSEIETIYAYHKNIKNYIRSKFRIQNLLLQKSYLIMINLFLVLILKQYHFLIQTFSV